MKFFSLTGLCPRCIHKLEMRKSGAEMGRSMNVRKGKYFFGAVCLLAVILLQIACAGTGQGGATKEAADTGPAAPEIPETIWEDQEFTWFRENPLNEGEPVTLTMWINEDWGESYAYLVQEYRKYRPNVEIKMTRLPWKSYWIKLRLAMENGNGPDLFHMHNAYGRDFKDNMQPLPDDIFGEVAMATSFAQPDGIRMDGALYCVGLGKSTGGIFYNKSMWQNAGLTEADFPGTWEQLRQLAGKLTQYDAYGNIIVDGFNFNGELPSLLFAMQAQKGLSVFSSDGSNCNLSHVENLENLSFLKALCHEDRVCRPNEAPAYELLGNNRAAMIYGWSWAANYLTRNHPDTEYGFYRIPAWEESVPPAYDYNNYESSFAINNLLSSEKQEAAIDLLLFYLCSDEVMMKTAIQAQMVPAKLSLLKERREDLGEVIGMQSEYIERTAFKGVLPEAVYAYLTPARNQELLSPENDIPAILKNMDREIGKILKIYEFKPQLEQYEYYHEFGSNLAKSIE